LKFYFRTLSTVILLKFSIFGHFYRDSIVNILFTVFYRVFSKESFL